VSLVKIKTPANNIQTFRCVHPGVLPVPGEGNVIEEFDPDSYSKKGAIFVERFFATLGSLEIFSAVIPGVFDAPIDEFLRLGMAAELKHPNIHLVHVTLAEKGDIAVFGLGGSITDSTSTCVGHYSRTLAQYYLRPICHIKPRRTVLLLANVPESWHGDLANQRILTDALAARYRPSVCILGSPGAKGSVERVAKTLLIHPGYLADGCAALLDMGAPEGEQAKLLNLRSTVAVK
jgi:hypothetical protein